MSSPALSLLQYLRITAAALRADARTDAELLSRYAQTRDETAFAALVVRHGPLVTSVCRHLLDDTPEVEDAFQVTFMALSRKASQIRIQTTLAGWLHRVARQAALDALSAANARRKLQERYQEIICPPIASEVVHDETYEVLHDELARLTEKLRDPLVLHYLEGKTQVEVARLLSVTERTVQNRLARGKSILQERLTQRGVCAGTATLANLLEETSVRAAVSIDLVRRTVGTSLAFRAGTFRGATSELARQVLKSLPYGMGWVMKTCLVALLCVGGLGAGAYVWRASTLPLPRPRTDGPRAVKVKEDPSPEEDKDAVSKTRLDLYGDPLPSHAVQRLGTVRFRPGRNTRLLEFTPDGKGLLTAAGYFKRPICLWDKESGQLLRQFGDFPNFCDAAIAAQGRIVAGWQAVHPGGKPEDILYVWDVATGKLLRQFKGKSTRRQYAISPNGKYLATDLEGSFGLREIVTGKTLWERKFKEGEFVEAVAISPDSNSIASSTFEHDKNGNELCRLRLWETHTGKILRTWKGDLAKRRVNRLEFSPDGNRLIAQTSENPREMVHLLDRITGKVMTLSEAQNGVCSPTGTTVATYNYGEGIWLWDMATGKLLRHLPEFSPRGLNRLVVFSPDGKLLAGTTKKEGLALWDVATGKILRHCQNSKQKSAGLAFSPDGKILAGMEGPALSCWEVATGKKLSRPRDYQGFVNSVAFTRDGKSVVSVEGNYCPGVVPIWRDDKASVVGNYFLGVMHIWDAHSGQERSAFPSRTIPRSPFIFGTGLCPDGRILAVGWDSPVPDGRKDIGLWDAVSGKKIQRLEKPHKYENYEWHNVIISSDHKYLICGLTTQKGDNMAVLWELATGKRLPRQFPGWGPALSPDGTILATQSYDPTGGNQHGVCYLWETATGKKIGEIKLGGPFSDLAFSRNGQTLLITDSYVAKIDEEKTKIQLYPLHRHKQLGVRIGVCRALLEISGCKQGINSIFERLSGIDNLTFAPDGKMLATSAKNRWDNDGTVYLWETATGKERGCFQGHNDGVKSLSFSPDGRRLASGSEDTTILIWDITGRLDDQGRLRPVRLSAKQLEESWADLAGTDAVRSNQAIWTLVAAGQSTVTFMAKQLRPVPGIAAQVLAQLIIDLDSDTYAVRQKARQQLKALGELAEPNLRQSLDKQPSLELRRNVDHLLALIEEQRAKPAGEALRMLRAIEVLEQIGTSEARKLLEALCTGAPGARQTEEAKASVARLTRRTVQP